MIVTGRKGWLLLALSVAFASSALAADNRIGGAAAGEESIVVDPQPQPWGGATDTAKVVGVGDLTPPNDTVTWITTVGGTGIGIAQTSAAQVDWWYQIHVPSGALLQRMEIEACDNSATSAIVWGMAAGGAPNGIPAPSNITPIGNTGTATTPGCAFFSVTPTAIPTVNNAGMDYWAFVDFSGTGLGAALNVHAIRFYYRLQVSPAPATATFPNDVPTTHPFFRFVEALARSGVTGGCGTGSFCPDTPVTRGQMAVFLATTLGMHFAP
jgi:S-layer homology domain